jgi:hypothetical protein
MGFLAIARARALVFLSTSGDMLYERATKIKNKPRLQTSRSPQVNARVLSLLHGSQDRILDKRHDRINIQHNTYWHCKKCL